MITLVFPSRPSMMQGLTLLTVLALLVGGPGCDALTSVPAPAHANLLDPQQPAYRIPEATFTGGPKNHEILRIDQATFTWQGNNDARLIQYSTSFDNGLWSTWGTNTSRTFDLLQDSAHEMRLISRLISGDPQRDTAVVDFIVDAYAGTTLFFRPSVIYNVGADSSVDLDLWFGDAAPWTSADFTIQGDPAFLRPLTGRFITGPGTYLHAASLIVDSVTTDAGTASMRFRVTFDPADSLTIQGTGYAATARFRVKRLDVDSIQIVLSPSSSLHGAGGVNVPIMELRPATISLSNIHPSVRGSRPVSDHRSRIPF